uniref:RNA-dependent RNA polymerase n=1 Tax=Papaya chlorotic spot associated virus TaxID=2978146 RepID=A0A977KC75_9VIRU|nr:RNA-dependent RNA polymerase [Papaya chlorotic spot associated virus]
MALTYRTPMEDIVASFEPAVQASIAAKAAIEYKQLEERNFNIANYHMKAEAKQKLSTAGIYLSPFSAIVHSHPVCKTLENHILFTVLPNYINNRFFFVGIKNSKVNLLKSRNSNLDMVSVINRYVTSADKVRYSNDFVVRSSKQIEGLSRHKAVLADVTLKDLVPNLKILKSKHMFLHDELHYWRPKDLITFLEVIKPEVLLGTVVYPPELLVGATSSLNSWCYQFEVKGNSLLFYPDGERSEGYEQPLKGGYLLTTREIILPDGEVYCVDLVCSKFAHHLVSITKGPALTNKYRSFGHFEAVSFSNLLSLSPISQPFFPVSFEVVSKMYRYLRSLKKPDLQSAMAKLSQIIPEPSADEIKFTQEFAELVISCDPMRSLLSVNRLQTFFGRVCLRTLPRWILDRMSLIKAISLDDFVKGLKPFTITLPLKSISFDFIEEIMDWNNLELEKDYDLVQSMEDKFYEGLNCGDELKRIKTRPPAPYSSLLPLQDVEGTNILFLNEADLVRCAARVLIKAFSFNSLSEISVPLISFLCSKIFQSHSILLNLGGLLTNPIFLDKVRARVCAVLTQKFKKPFKFNLVWFLKHSSHRGCQFYLANYVEEPRFAFPLSNLWKTVTHEASVEGKKRNRFKGGTKDDREHNEGDSVKSNELGNAHDLDFENLLEQFGLQDIDPNVIKNLIDIKMGDHELDSNGSETVSLKSDKTNIESDSGVGACEIVHLPSTLPSTAFKELCPYTSLKEFVALKLGYQESTLVEIFKRQCIKELKDCSTQAEVENVLSECSKIFNLDIKVLEKLESHENLRLIEQKITSHVDQKGLRTFFLMLSREADLLEVIPRNICVLQALSDSLGRSISEVFGVLNDVNFKDILKELLQGEGIELNHLENLFNVFGIKATVETDQQTMIMNENGNFTACFKLEGNHLEYLSSPLKSTGLAPFSGKVGPFKFNESVNLVLQNIGTTLPFKAKLSRANLLADCLHSGNTGVLMSELFNKEKHLLNGNLNLNQEPESVEVKVILGTFGVGKSRLFRTLISKARGNQFDFVSPRRALLNEIKAEIELGKDQRERKLRGQQNWFFSTFERFLQRVTYLREDQFVFIDEIQLFPNGYLDLLICLLKVKVNLVVFGDPCQSDYDGEKDRTLLSNITSNIDSLLKSKNYKYNILSYRFENSNFVGRLPCLFAEGRFKKEKQPYLIYNDLEDLSLLPADYSKVILVSSFEEKKIVSSYCPTAKEVLTFGESTGLNFKKGTILVTMISEKTSEKRWVTALSRFKENLAIINATGYSIEGLNSTYRSRFLGKFLTGNASVDDLTPHLPGQPEFVEGFELKVGKDEGIREDKLQGDPWLKSMIDLFQIEDMETEEVSEIAQQIESFKIHLPREELEGTRSRWVHRILNKEFREVRMGSLISDQFTDEHSKQRGAVQLTNAAERFETIYPRHRANDTVTFIMAVKKRLRFSKPHKETAKLNQALPYGRYLLNEFLKKIPLKKNRNNRLMEESRQEFFDKKTSKSAATIENHNVRSCRDWLADVVQVFSKSQLCTKFDNRFRTAKAAQSIACFQHSVLCRFAPYMRYIEKKLHEALPKRFYIHSGKSLEQLNDWVINGDFSGECTESDYEAFDASQDQYIVAFEIEIMKYLGLPNDLIQDYIYIKTHLGSKLGSFAIMRFTGEASTFLFNTMANMLFTFLRYNLKGNENICFAGDDMCSSKRLTVRKEHEGFLKKIKLKAKVQHTTKPTFCGWHLCPDGIYKKPQLVFERICIARETNNLQNCIDSYAIEVSYAYKLGERIMSRMDEEELGAYYGCVRTIIKYKHLLKSDVKALFESLD